MHLRASVAPWLVEMAVAARRASPCTRRLGDTTRAVSSRPASRRLRSESPAHCTAAPSDNVTPPALRASDSLLDRFLVQAATWYTWLPLLPLIVRAARSFRSGGKVRLVRVPVQLLAAVYIVFLHGVLTAVVRWATGVSTSPSLLTAVTNFPFYDFASGFTRYCLIAAFYHLSAYHQEVRLRDLSTVQLQASLTQARLDNLQGLVQPHFLFNTLNSIAELIRSEPAQAEQMVEYLAELLRFSLTFANENEVSLAEELTLLEKYTAIEQVRFGERLRVELDVPPELRQARVPLLLLQPLVENAIRHGLAPREEPGLVRISAQSHNGSLHIQVQDNGVGPGTVAQGTGIGLRATRERLRHLYGEAQRLEIGAAQLRGTVVTIELPLRVEART